MYIYICMYIYKYMCVCVSLQHSVSYIPPPNTICVHIHTYTHVNAYLFFTCHSSDLTATDPLSCRSFSTKEPQNIGHFFGK